MKSEQEGSVQALQYALDIEKKGYRFYRTAARSTDDPEGRRVFEHLSRDEVQHMRAFAALFKALTNDEPWMTYEEAIARHGETPEEELVFPDADPEAQEHFDDLEALREALDFEKKTAQFYTERASEVTDEKAKSFYGSLIEMEKGHAAIVQAEIDSLLSTGFWLGYQEISLEH